MYITTSKNADSQLKNIAKSIASCLPQAEYISRSKRPVEKICAIAKKKAFGAVLVLMRKGTEIEALRLEKKGDGWEWNPGALAISKVRAQKFSSQEPIIFDAKSKEAKKIAQFLGLKDSLVAKLYDECACIKVEAKKNSLKLKYEKEDILSMDYKWVEWKE